MVVRHRPRHHYITFTTLFHPLLSLVGPNFPSVGLARGAPTSTPAAVSLTMIVTTLFLKLSIVMYQFWQQAMSTAYALQCRLFSTASHRRARSRNGGGVMTTRKKSQILFHTVLSFVGYSYTDTACLPIEPFGKPNFTGADTPSNNCIGSEINCYVPRLLCCQGFFAYTRPNGD
jgi:lysylphosphatidylglycerol synthetase-like protein (DUF2156 family)